MRSDTTASGRSPHRLSGNSDDRGLRDGGTGHQLVFQVHSEEVHSPPDFTRSFDRSQIRMQPWASMRTDVAGLEPAVRGEAVVTQAAVVAGRDPGPTDLEFTNGGVIPFD